MEKKKVLGLIPARSGSKGIRNKNIYELNGHPLMAYSIAAGLQSTLIDRVIVSTDSEAYAETALQYGAEVPFLRPKDFSGDASPDYHFVRHALDWLGTNEDYVPDYIVHLRPTSPLRCVEVIDCAIRKLDQTSRATALRSIHKMSESAYKAFEIHNDVLYPLGKETSDLDGANNARQTFPDTFVGNGYVDVLRRNYIMEAKALHGDRVLAYVTPRISEIDEVDDLVFVEYEMSRKRYVFALPA